MTPALTLWLTPRKVALSIRMPASLQALRRASEMRPERGDVPTHEGNIRSSGSVETPSASTASRCCRRASARICGTPTTRAFSVFVNGTSSPSQTGRRILSTERSVSWSFHLSALTSPQPVHGLGPVLLTWVLLAQCASWTPLKGSCAAFRVPHRLLVGWRSGQTTESCRALAGRRRPAEYPAHISLRDGFGHPLAKAQGGRCAARSGHATTRSRVTLQVRGWEPWLGFVVHSNALQLTQAEEEHQWWQRWCERCGATPGRQGAVVFVDEVGQGRAEQSWP